jgi:ABC-2 type transport system ATP-binding protein
VAEPVVVTEGLTKRFGPVDALTDLSVEIPAQTWGLLGPNGAGKTTLLRLLLGLTEPTSGSLEVAGLDPSRDPVRVREQTGFTPERDAFVPGLTGSQYVTYAGEIGGLPQAEAAQRAHSVLDFVGLGEARYREIEDYSQGMRQRAKIAAALVHDPDLVFLDEPTNGLDPEGREEMLDLIASIARGHDVSVLMASHILPEVEAVCQGALVLSNGQAVANASLEQLTAVRRSTLRVRIRGDVDAFREALAAREADLEQTPEGFVIVHLPEDAGPRTVLEASREADVEVRELTPTRQDLEEALVTSLQEGSA